MIIRFGGRRRVLLVIVVTKDHVIDITPSMVWHISHRTDSIDIEQAQALSMTSFKTLSMTDFKRVPSLNEAEWIVSCEFLC